MELEDIEIDTAVEIAIELLVDAPQVFDDGAEYFEEMDVLTIIRAWYPSVGGFGDPRLQCSIDRVIKRMIEESVLAS